MKFSLLIEAAQRGDPAAAFACGLALENGWSVEPSVAEAQKWYKLAANSLPIAKYALAKSLTVHGDPDSLGPGFAKAAAELGLVQAATFLGLLYRHGNGVEKSEDEATRWLSLASESGDGRATAALGSPFFQSETGTCLDVSKALPIFERSYKQGYVPAAASIARILFQIGGQEDVAKGLAFLEEAGKQDEFDSLMMLGMIYSHGLYGQQSSSVQSDAYYKRALAAQRKILE